MTKVRVSFEAADRPLYDEILKLLEPYIVEQKSPQKSAGSAYNRTYLVLETPPTKPGNSDGFGENA